MKIKKQKYLISKESNKFVHQFDHTPKEIQSAEAKYGIIF